MADKDNESAPGVVCCNLDSDDVKRLFRLADRHGRTIQQEATELLKTTLYAEYLTVGFYDLP